jgi:glycolate oxidase FAD binding subunit
MARAAGAGGFIAELATLAGAASIRPAVDADAIDAIAPALVVEPETPEILAAVLAWASRQGARVVLRGGGTRLAWGRRPAAFDLVIGTGRLSRILHHEPGDLTVSVEAGMPVATLNRELAVHGQALPLDVPSEASTIGGLLAVNDSGPRRHRHGAPRDLLIGMHLATTDGRLAKAGGNVVKNVAGYDLGRLMCGSFGSLAAIVSATFKLAPAPAATASLVCDFASADALGRASAAIAESQLDPMCVDVRIDAGAGRAPGGTQRLLIRFAGLPRVNDAQLAEAERRLAPFDPRQSNAVSGDTERQVWDDQTRGPWSSPGTVVKLSWLPATLAAVADLVATLGRTTGATLTLTARAALGTGHLHVDGDTRTQATAIATLRAHPDIVSHVVIARASPDVKALADVWSPPGDTLVLLQRIKATMDPHGVLNASRGPI